MTTPLRTVLFFAKDPHNVVVYERVLRRLLADSRLRVLLTSKNDHVRPENDLFNAFDLPGAERIHHRWAALRRFDLYLSPDILLLGRRCRIKVHTFHGISIKGKAYTEKVLAYDRLFLIGPYMRERFVERGVLKAGDSRFVDVGMPKTDGLLDGSFPREAFLARHGLDPSRPTILYAPTWRPESSLYSVGEELMRSMRGRPFNFVVKLHDLALSSTEPVNWKEKLPSLAAENVVILKELDITPAMAAADLLISDASSVANEFTLLDRPIVFVDVPALLQKYGGTIDLNRWGQQAGPVAADVAGIHKAIEASLSDPGSYSVTRRRIAGEGFYNPGRATEAAVRELYRLLELAMPGGGVPD